jgi:hypothetical protein
MNTLVSRKTINLCMHPITWFAIFLIVLNDLLLKTYWQGWFSGKISDLAWIYIAPICLALFLSFIIPVKLAEKIETGWFIYLFMGLGFVVTKTNYSVNSYINQISSMILAVPVQNLVDPTDVIALAGWMISLILWNRSSPNENRSLKLKLLAFPILAIVLLADAPMPDSGITCVDTFSDQIIATSVRSRFVSNDSGLTWSNWDQDGICNEENETEISSTDGRLLFRYNPGEKIEVSTDNGTVWITAYDLKLKSDLLILFNEKSKGFTYSPGPHSAVYDSNSGNFIFAMGHDGVLIRKESGEWIWEKVGEYSLTTPTFKDRIFILLDGQYLLAILISLVVFNSSLIDRLKSKLNFWVNVLMVIGTILLSVFVNPIINSSYVNFMFFAGLIVLIFITFSITLSLLFEKPYKRWDFYKRPTLLSLSAGTIYLVLILLWTYWIIPQFYMAVAGGLLSMFFAIYTARSLQK